MDIKMKAIPKEQYDIATVKMAEQIAKLPNVRELAAHIADISTILDRMNYNAGSGWEDQAVIALMAGTRMAAWQAAGHPPLSGPEGVPMEVKAANDNDKPDDMKMAA